MRIVSLLPSATEVLCAIGLRQSLVGRSHECDHPEGIDDIPVLTGPRPDERAPDTAAAPDTTERATRVLSPYAIDAELLRSLEPDLVITQDLCAVSTADVEQALAEVAGPDVTLLALAPTTLRDVMHDILRIGQATGAARNAEAVLRTCESRISAIHQRAASAPTRTVLTIEWFSPPMLGGLWTPELVSLVNGRALLARPGVKAPTVSVQTIAGTRPDVVLLKPCGLALPATLAQARDFLPQLPEDWPPFAARTIWATDGNAYFNRPGPRIVDSLEILAACVHPERFSIPATSAAVRVPAPER
ncbi:MAG: cobalamin-binding protein [Deltaproteobacteria bacterium]|nr:MAG: cobalamin-binding protein [Deltaproteobacteria bacterium]